MKKANTSTKGNRPAMRATVAPSSNGSAGSSLAKSATGMSGMDEIIGGGLPQGRPTLVCGSAGAGKTLFAMEFLVRGATQFGEPGVFVSFEEKPEELTRNVASLGFDLDKLQRQKKMAIEFIHVERSEIEETGEYDLEGLFIRLGYAIDSIGAKRVALDTIETLFAGLSNTAILRAELRRLFRWLKDKGVTAIITGERGEGQLTRHGLEEYVSDCVILLDHRVTGQISTRRLRVVKYRGSTHGTNEYPFLIDEDGISVLPITSLELRHKVSSGRISSGILALDQMLGDGGGFYEGSSVLVSGTAGTGKTSIANSFAEATCQSGEKVLYFAFEESPDQIMRNMKSIGIDLQPHVRSGCLQYHAARPTMFGLEMHLAVMHKMIKEFQPAAVVVDPISNLISAGAEADVAAMLMRLVDFLKAHQITSVFTSLTSGGGPVETTENHISSLIDTWLLLRDIEIGGERNRGMYILKSRGMAHSNQIREFRLTRQGVQLTQVYVGPEGVLTGSARLSQEAREEAAKVGRQQEVQRKQRELERKRKLLQAQIEALRAQFEAEKDELQLAMRQDRHRQEVLTQEQESMARSRQAGAGGNGNKRKATGQKGRSR